MENREPFQIEELLKIDSGNTEVSLRALADRFPEAVALMNACGECFREIANAYGASCNFDEYQQSMDDWAREAKIRPVDGVGLLKHGSSLGGAPDDSYGRARRAYILQVAVLARSVLFSRAQRDYGLGVCELLRGRPTHTIGVRRTQAETAAILLLVAETPEIGEEWWDTSDSDLGRDFHARRNRQIAKRRNSLGFDHDFDWGTSAVHHVRPAGIALGMRAVARNRVPGSVGIAFHEVHSPEQLFLWFALYMQFHRRLLSARRRFFPEIPDAVQEQIDQLPFWEIEARASSQLIAWRNALGRQGVADRL